jgi:predicted ATPase/DNA-binding CsgD family transcriptional regulator
MYPASLLLPDQPTPLVGRTAELETISQRLAGDGVRLLTLTGPAGVGKTRLALAAAASARLADRFPDGGTVVDLAPIRDPSLVLPAIARALGLADAGPPPLPERLRAFLGEREQLLVLDNLEQVLPAGAALADLLAGCPGLALLVTSRVPLQLRWEQALRVAPLPVPDLSAALPPLDALARIPAVALFVERARARRADFALTEKQAPLVAQLVVQLDGLPLALELAAARLGALPLPTIAHRLEDRLRLLRWEAPDVPERQQSLEAAVGWSYDLLSAGERRLFRCLGVFVGRVALDAITAVVAAVAGAGDAGDGGRTLKGLASLAEQSLILPGRPDGPEAEDGADGEEDEEDPEPAFGMLETVREYAREQLTRHGELAAAQRAHAHSFLALAERAEPQLCGRDQRAWFLRLEREQDNLRAALRWLLDQDDPAEREAGLRLARALGWLWWRRGYYAEGRRWLEEALARAPEAQASVRTRALVAAGAILTVQGDVARARAVLEEGLALAQQQQDPTDIAHVHTEMGLGAVFAGDVEEATRRLHEALRRWEALGNPEGLGETLFYLGLAADTTGDAAAAAAHYTAALQRFGAAGDAHFAGFVRCYLGVIMWKRGDLPRAVEQVQAGVQASVTLRDPWLLSFGAQATAALVGARADPAAQARLLGATDALAQGTGATPVWERMPAGQDVGGLREHREQGEWGAAYQEGRALPVGEVAALALSLLEEVAQALADREATPASAQQSEQPSQHPSPLSEREGEVLRLVAQGLSSKAIGRRLSISPSTVNYHLTSVFHKLGVDTRAQAVAVATQRGLL